MLTTLLNGTVKSAASVLPLYYFLTQASISHGHTTLGQLASSEPEIVDVLQLDLESLDCAYIILNGIGKYRNIKAFIKVIKLLGK